METVGTLEDVRSWTCKWLSIENWNHIILHATDAIAWRQVSSSSNHIRRVNVGVISNGYFRQLKIANDNGDDSDGIISARCGVCGLRSLSFNLRSCVFIFSVSPRLSWPITSKRMLVNNGDAVWKCKRFVLEVCTRLKALFKILHFLVLVKL